MSTGSLLGPRGGNSSVSGKDRDRDRDRATSEACEKVELDPEDRRPD